MYKICLKWCKNAGIYSISDLEARVIDRKEYETLWYKRCDDLQKKLAIKRAKNKQ